MLVDIGYYVWRTPLTREREREYTFVYEQNSFACKTPRGAAQRSAAQRARAPPCNRNHFTGLLRVRDLSSVILRRGCIGDELRPQFLDLTQRRRDTRARDAPASRSSSGRGQTQN
jgi:hypothetical protein